MNIIDLDMLRLRADEGVDSKYDIVFLGRLAYPKNPVRFVEIISLLAEHIPNVKAAIIGDGIQKDITIQRIHDLKMEKNISVLGFLANPLGILRNAKALVMTSFWEGTPMCALEALGLGTPVLSTPVDGLKDIIVNKENGFLSSSNEVIASQLHKILCEPEYSDWLSRNAVLSAEKINNKSKYLSTLLNEYSRLI